MSSPSVPETFCEPDVMSSSQNAKQGRDLFNSSSTPALSLSITGTDRAGCNPRKEPELPLAGTAKPGPRGGILAHWERVGPVQRRICPQERGAGGDRALPLHAQTTAQICSRREGGTGTEQNKPWHGPGFHPEESGAFSRQIGPFIRFAVNSNSLRLHFQDQ